MIGEMIGETTEAYTPEAAFLAAWDGNVLFGEPLRKYSFSRKIAAQAMGCQAPILPPESREMMLRSGMYPGAINDCLIVTWVCTLKDNSEMTPEDYRADTFTPERATNQPVKAMEQARKWGEAHKIDNVAGPEFYEAWKKFLEVMFGIDASAFEIQVEERPGEPALEPPSSPKATPGKAKQRTSSRTSPK